jgi:tetratricopeptide (TPR) repeat protein
VARLQSANAVRAPSLLRDRAEGRGGEAGDGDDGRPRLRLVVTRGRLGVELERAFALGPLTVTELAFTLPDARFPVDLSGGIGAFRNRRGELERLAVEVHAKGESWARPLRGLLGDAKPVVLLAPCADGWLVGLRAGDAALAFEVVVVAADDALRLIPVEARGLGLAAPPHALALAALVAATKPFSRIVGGVMVIERAARLLVQELLPLAGMRAPGTDGVRWSAPVPAVGTLSVHAGTDVPSAPSERAIRAVEVAALAADADEALLRGDLEEARRRYLQAIEQAPRHPELVRRLAEVDRAEGRAELGLGALADLGPAGDADLLAADLYERVGDLDSARMAFERAAESESYGTLAAAAWARLARLQEGRAQLAHLDRAVARAPSWLELRWARFDARIAAGELAAALTDAAELEAATRGSDKRARVAERVAETLLRERHLQPASVWFERALRYQPDRAETLGGLARSLGALGQGRRALELHVRAVGLAKKSTHAEPSESLRLVTELARALVAYADDRPAAIAHVRSIPAGLVASFEARLLEGRWRAEIGDMAGASEAFARLGDEAERALGALSEVPEGPSDASVMDRFGSARRDVAAHVASYLEEAARIEELERGDRLAAKRLLGIALRLAPRRGTIQAAFRRVASEPVSQAKRLHSDEGAHPTQSGTVPVEIPVATGAIAPPAENDPADDEVSVEKLSDQLRADPSNASVVLELASALERLGRDHDLLALLSARIEEEGEPLRSELLPRRRLVLERLRDLALAEGRDSEAELYELLLSRD